VVSVTDPYGFLDRSRILLLYILFYLFLFYFIYFLFYLFGHILIRDGEARSFNTACAFVHFRIGYYNAMKCSLHLRCITSS
jgi:hypothetical protein